MTREIDTLLEVYPDLDDLFEVLDITPFEVVEILLRIGRISLPPFLSEEVEDAEDRTA